MTTAPVFKTLKHHFEVRAKITHSEVSSAKPTKAKVKVPLTSWALKPIPMEEIYGKFKSSLLSMVHQALLQVVYIYEGYCMHNYSPSELKTMNITNNQTKR